MIKLDEADYIDEGYIFRYILDLALIKITVSSFKFLIRKQG